MIAEDKREREHRNLKHEQPLVFSEIQLSPIIKELNLVAIVSFFFTM